MRRPARLSALAAAVGISLATVAGAGAEPVVFAAASTRGALDAALAAGGQEAVVSYGASGTIARQIAAGAPADVFLSANPRWMAYLIDEGAIDPDAVQVLVSNRLVLVAPEDAGPVALTSDALAARLGDSYFAMADPEVAPVGQYGRDALQTLALWPNLVSTLLPTRNTLATVATVARGEAPLGLVYRSDAQGAAGVEIAAELPAEAHPPIRYLIAPVAGGADPDAAAALIAFLLEAPAARDAFSAAGFAPAPVAVPEATH